MWSLINVSSNLHTTDVETLGKLTPWLFAMDRMHYSRWVPVHIRNMIQMKDTHPSV